MNTSVAEVAGALLAVGRRVALRNPKTPASPAKLLLPHLDSLVDRAKNEQNQRWLQESARSKIITNSHCYQRVLVDD